MHWHTMKKGWSLALVLVLSLAFVIAGCSDDDDDAAGPAGGEGTIAVTMTDAPFPFDMVSEANVTINKVEVRHASMDDEEEGAFIVINEDTHNLNLLDLQNGVTAALGDTLVPTGSYDLVRLYVQDASVTLTNGTTYDVNVPSGASSGLKVFLSPALSVNADVTNEILIDFDVSKSFVALGNLDAVTGITGFNFKPVLRAVNRTETGAISGTVTDSTGASVEDAAIQISNQDSILTSSATDANGDYTVIGLPAGDYTVTAVKDTLQASSSATVTANSTTTVDLTLGPAPSGTMTLSMTDAPFHFDVLAEANVTIDSIEARFAGEDTAEMEDPFVTVYRGGETFNLLELQNGVDTTLAELEVRAGEYNQLRLYVSDASVIDTAGNTYNLTVPSGAASGLKINIWPYLTVDVDGAAEVLLDMDVSKSFVMRGNWNNLQGFNFKPVIRATNRAETGTLTGTVTDTSGAAIVNAHISVATADSVITSSATDSSGSYTILGLLAGDYDVTAGANGYQDSTVTDVSISAGAQTTADFELNETETMQ